MHSAHIIAAMLLGTVGVPLALAFLLTYLVSLGFKRCRAFALRVLGRSILVTAVATLAYWAWAQSGLPKPYHYQAALSTSPFWFGVTGFFLFIRSLVQTRKVGGSNNAI